MILVPRKRLQDLSEILDTEDFPVCLLLHDRSAAAAASSRLQIAPTGGESPVFRPRAVSSGWPNAHNEWLI